LWAVSKHLQQQGLNEWNAGSRAKAKSSRHESGLLILKRQQRLNRRLVRSLEVS